MARYGYLLPTRGSVLGSDGRETLAAKTESDVIGLARRAEALGLDAVWVGDSVLAKPRHDPMTTLATVAGATEAIELGTAVHLPALRHPIHVAHRTATVDQVSGGRLRWGVGVGTGPDVEAEHAGIGVPFDERGPRLDELLDLVTALWEGGRVDHDGAVFRLRDAGIGFGPARAPPIYVASAAFDPSQGFPSPIEERIVAHGDGWLPIGLEPDQYAAGLETIRATLADAGRSPDAFDPAYYVDVVIDQDEERAIQTARAFYDRYYPAWGELSDDDVREHGAFGPAEDVATALEAFADAGVETFVVRFTSDDQRAQLRRFVDRVR